MFTQPAPSPPTLATSNPPVSTVSPQRPSRLRGLSYLRNYTQNHLHSRDSGNDNPGTGRRNALSRSTSYPSPTTSGNGQGGTTSASLAQRAPPGASTSAAGLESSNIENQESPGPTSGWLPTGGGHSGISRIAAQSQLPPTALASAPLPGNNSADNITRSIPMGRTRSATTGRATESEVPQMNGGGDPPQLSGSVPSQPIHVVNGENTNQLPSIRFSQHQDMRAARPSLVFSPMGRTLPTGREIIRVGRYSERENQPNPASNVPSSAPIGFKSKVVSRRHCEFWYEDGQWFIKDVKSSSGTFLNHVRLSSPATESKPFPVKDGDIVQLGIDFKGGEEMIFRCVKIRIELNRGWQNALNSFNVASHKRLRNMAKQNLSPTSGSSSQDCTICLGAVAPCQSLFVAPCSHTWHYKCVRRIINSPMWPQFICPNCRAVADLEADVDDPFPDAEWEEADAAEEEEHQTDAPIQVADTAPTLQIPTQERSRSRGDSAMNRTPLPAHDTPGEDTTGSESELRQAITRLNMESDMTTATNASQDSQSSSKPINVRSGRSSVRNEDTSTATAADSNFGTFTRPVRTPSPNDRLPPGVGDSSMGPDGPMTPRNDAGPFVFDGSAGRASGARMSELSLLAAAENHTPE